MDNRLIRLAYTIEFLIALPVAYAVWGQIAGQAHLDLVFWYWKLGLGLAVAYSVVRATAAAMEHGRAWNLRTVKWVAILVLLGAGAGMVTYYVHLYYEEPAEEEVIEEEEPAYTGSRPRSLGDGGPLHVESGKRAGHAHLAIAAR